MGTFTVIYHNLTVRFRFEGYQVPWKVGAHIDTANLIFIIKSLQELDEDGEEILPDSEDEASSFCGSPS